MTEAETVAPLLATRVRKARAETICPRCHCLIRIGQPIGKVGREWIHLRPCLLGGKAPVLAGHDAP